jgi:hypothetical protein
VDNFHFASKKSTYCNSGFTDQKLYNPTKFAQILRNSDAQPTELIISEIADFCL